MSAIRLSTERLVYGYRQGQGFFAPLNLCCREGEITAILAGMTAGSYLIRSGQSDMHISYASYLPLLLNQPDLHVVHLPDPYRIDAEYMLAIMKPARREPRLLANYLLSPEGQNFLVNKGFASLF
ncbi:substrate-binding domain-containing protein [Pectobacterium colocasium]|uniref:substrate-binding domain-containing protein n=1 Tax=Pectobacterium colocasium TaxID=2878098 RepID=UPI001CD391E2|nr:substrate-binding domain-containing protein [Pectobacterium colocasium]